VNRILLIIGGLILGGILDLNSNNIPNMALASPTDATAVLSPQAQISEGPRMPLGRGSHAGGIVDGRVVIVGGTSWNRERTVKSFLNTSVVYKESAWQPGPSINVALAEGAYADDGRSLYLAGGLSQPTQQSNLVCRIAQDDTGHMIVQNMTPLPMALSACAATILGNRLYVACGTLAAGKSTNQLWSLDLQKPSAQWRSQAPLPAAGRAYPALVTCGANLYLLGGLGDGDKSVHDRTLSDAYQYDPSTDRWTALGILPFGGYCWSADAVDDSHILLAGRADGTIHNEIWLLHLPDLSTELLGHAVIQATCAPLMKVGPRKWWLVGGEPDSNKNRTDRVTVISLP
jgi:N-acetylneuraminic acid mutarotase